MVDRRVSLCVYLTMRGSPRVLIDSFVRRLRTGNRAERACHFHAGSCNCEVFITPSWADNGELLNVGRTFALPELLAVEVLRLHVIHFVHRCLPIRALSSLFEVAYLLSCLFRSVAIGINMFSQDPRYLISYADSVPENWQVQQVGLNFFLLDQLIDRMLNNIYSFQFYFRI